MKEIDPPNMALELTAWGKLDRTGLGDQPVWLT